MTRRLRLALLPVLLGGAARAAALQPMFARQDAAFGVLLLGEEWDQDWRQSLAAMAKKLAPQFPLEYAAGQADVKTIQAAVDRLQDAGVKKLVVVPLFLDSNAPVLDQTRFLFGIRKEPSQKFLNAPNGRAGAAVLRRVSTKLPVVVTSALDDDPVVVDILADRARSLSHHPEAEAVVLVGLAPDLNPAEPRPLGRNLAAAPLNAENEYLQTLSGLAERVRAKGGFKSARAAVLQPEALNQSERDRHVESLRKLVRSLALTQRVLVIPHAMTSRVASPLMRNALEGSFARYLDKGLLPDDRIISWIGAAARRGAALPDMRVYKGSDQEMPSGFPPLRTRPFGSRP